MKSLEIEVLLHFKKILLTFLYDAVTSFTRFTFSPIIIVYATF